MRNVQPKASDGLRWSSLILPGAESDVPVRIYRPGPEPSGLLVWAHGGSWISGSVDDWHVACAELALASCCTVVSVNYRLAPRHPHPAALTDVAVAVEWAQRQAEHDGAPGAVAVGGDSAGATIAACLALAWRERRPLAGQVLAYPPLDPECRAASYHRSPDTFPTREWLMSAWCAYRGHDGGAGRSALVHSTPFDAADLTGLPPAVLAVGQADPVVDDVHEYARRLRDAGCTVDLREFPRMGHGAFLMNAGSAGGNVLHQWLGKKVRQLMEPALFAGKDESPSAG